MCAALCASAGVALGLGGCTGLPTAADSIAGTPDAVELSTLSPAQTMRDSVARSEAATVERAAQMARAATECATCATMLSSVTQDAEARLAASGGLWEPWGDFSDREDAESFVEVPAQIGQAPYTVGPLAAFMLRSAREQLDELAQVEGLTGPEREALASLLAGRVASAQLLADGFAVDLATAVADLPESATSPAAPVENSRASGIDQMSGADQMSGILSSEQLDDDSESTTESALVLFDCARTSALSLGGQGLEHDTASALATLLNDRVKRLLEVGVEDTRPLRCTTPQGTVEGVLRDILTADLLLVGSRTASLRAPADISYDAQLWAQLDPVSAPTVSLLPIVEENGEPQS